MAAAWTVIARLKYDGDDGSVSGPVIAEMTRLGFHGPGKEIWECACDGEDDMQRAVDAVVGSISGQGNGVTLNHVILMVVPRQ